MQDQINKANEILKQGGIILYPTDTIWGIGCDATNEEAVKRIYKLKKQGQNSKVHKLTKKRDFLKQSISEMINEISY